MRREAEMLGRVERVGYTCLWAAIFTGIGILVGLCLRASYGAIGELRALAGI